MSLNNLTKEELDQMTYGEITELILSENNDKMRIVDIFKKICELLNMSDGEFESKIADFFELVSTDKNFIILESGYCDLRKKHTPKVIIEEDDEEDDIELEDTAEEESIDIEQNEEEDIYYDNSSDEDDVDDDNDDLSDFMVVDNEEEEPSM